jgi:dTDP-4-dehydrorhamnose reductase
MKKILVFGSTGMIGHVIYKYLDSLKEYRVFGTALRKNMSVGTHLLDVRDQEKVRNYLTEIQPDIVINCVGLLIEESQNDVEAAIFLNSLFPNVLSRLGREFGFKLIQISTDCVFSGKEGNYSEDSLPDGTTVYARTKALGEIKNSRDLTIRTSLIGPELTEGGSGLLDWFLRQNGEIFGYSQVFWTGVTTLRLAKAVEQFIKQEITGLYNFILEKKISKYNLLVLFKEIWQKGDIIINAEAKNKNDKSLCCNRTDLQFDLKNYTEMLVELHEWMESNKDLYQGYF